MTVSVGNCQFMYLAMIELKNQERDRGRDRWVR